MAQETRKRSSRSDRPELPDTLVAAELFAETEHYNRLLLGTLALDRVRLAENEPVGYIQLSPRSPRSPRGSGGTSYSALRQSRGATVNAIK